MVPATSADKTSVMWISTSQTRTVAAIIAAAAINTKMASPSDGLRLSIIKLHLLSDTNKNMIRIKKYENAVP